MFRSRISFLVLAVTLTTVSCDTSLVEPTPATNSPRSVTPGAISNSVSLESAGASSFYQGCLASGSLDAVSSIGTSTSASLLCKGKGTAVVLRAGSALGFCYVAGKSPSAYTVGDVPSCKAPATPGALAAGTDYYGCVDRGRLTAVTTQAFTCSKGTLVGFSKPRSYNLTVVKAGDGSGSVTSDVGGIDCGAVCSAAFVENTSINLTRSASSGSVFGDWSDSTCTGATCQVLVTSNATITATFNADSCTPSLAIDGPPVRTDGVTLIYRKDSTDFRSNLQLSGSTCGSWTTAWSYQQGDDAPAPVPAEWIIGDTLRVPRWTLEKYTSTGKRYTFTLTATPPVSSTLSPLTTTRLVQVLGTRPLAAYSPYGFTQAIPPRIYTFDAFGGLPATIDYDNPPGSPRLRYTWYAEVYGADEIPPVSGQGTPTVKYNFTPAETFLIRLEVCASDEPGWDAIPVGGPYGLTGCSTSVDFILSTNGG